MTAHDRYAEPALLPRDDGASYRIFTRREWEPAAREGSR